MAYGIALKVWGDYACFTRPEMKVERVSYDVITPSAARGILEAVYWKPEIRWVVQRIHVMNPVRFANIRRNELSQRLSAVNAKRAMRDSSFRIETFIEEDRQQRMSIVLVDVCYVIEARFEITGGTENPAKHLDQFNRRARRGQCWHRPYLGCREFDAHFELVEGELPHSSMTGEKDLGWMLHDIDFDNDNQPRFFRATMRDGVIEVPEFSNAGVAG